MMNIRILSALAAALIVPALATAQAPPTPAEAVAGTAVIPRSALFGNPEKTQGRLSPDGKYISFIAPRDGVLNVWVAERGKLDAARPITNDQKRGIRQHFWAFDNKHVLFIQDEGGDENFHLYAVDVIAGTQKDLTPYKGIRAEVAGLSWKKPGVVAVRINDRVPEWHDLWEVDLATGKRVLVEQNTNEISAYELDIDLKPRVASKNDAEGTELLRRVGDKWVIHVAHRPGGFADHRRHRRRVVGQDRAVAVLRRPRQGRARARGSRHWQDHTDSRQRTGGSRRRVARSQDVQAAWRTWSTISSRKSRRSTPP